MLFCAFSAPAAAALTPSAWVPDGQILSMVEDSGTLFVGGYFRYFAPKVGSGVVTDPNSGANLTSALDINGPVHAAIPDGAGGWILGGSFTRVLGQKRGGLAHISASGVLNPGFAPNVLGGDVTSLLLDGGLLYVGGSFRAVNEVPRRCLAALDPAGTLQAWAPELAAANGYPVAKVLASYNGLIYVGGEFDSVNGVSRTALAAVDSTGVLDAWDPQLTQGGCYRTYVQAIQTVGSGLYFGGCFATVLGQARSSLAGIDAAGTLLAFDAQMGAMADVRCLKSDGSTLYVGGSYWSLGGAGRTGLGAIDVGSSLATSFNPAGFVNAYSLELDGGTLYVGGSSQNFSWGVPRSWTAAFSIASGALAAWDPKVTGAVHVLSASGGRLFAGGSFSGAGSAQARQGLASFDSAGTLLAWAPDLTFSAQVEVTSLAVGGGLVYAGGPHEGTTTLNRPGVIALDRFSALPSVGFNAQMASYQVRSLTLSATALYIGGSFFNAGGFTRNNLAALNLVSGAALPFRADADSMVSHLALGNRLYVGGQFSTLSGSARPGLGAVNPATGALLPFNPAPIVVDSWAQTVTALLPFGDDVFVGGGFTSIGGSSRRSLARLSASGAAHPFDAQISGSAWSSPQGLALFQGSLMLGGYYSSLQGAQRGLLAQVDPGSGALSAWRMSTWSSGSNVRFAVQGTNLVVGGEYGYPDGQIGQNLCWATQGPDGTPDPYESVDDNLLAALALVPDGPPVARTLHDAYESNSGDGFTLTVVSGTAYTIETLSLLGGADPLLYLVHIPNYPDSTGMRWLALSDDRAPGDLNASLTWTADFSGSVAVVVLPRWAAQSGAGVGYSIRVTTLAPGTPTITPTASPTYTETPALSPTPSPTITPTATPGDCMAVTQGYTVSGAPIAIGGLVIYQGLSVVASTDVVGMSVDVNTPEGLGRLALYADNGSGLPGAVLAQSSDFTLVAGANDVTITPVSIPPGRYFMAFQAELNPSIEHVTPGPWSLWYGIQGWGTPFVASPGSLTTVPFTQSLRILGCMGPLPTATPTATNSPVYSPTPSPTAIACTLAAQGYSFTGNPVMMAGVVTFQGLSLAASVQALGISVDVATPMGLARVGLYADNGSGAPGALLAQSADFATLAGANDRYFAAQNLAPGLYFLAYQSDQNATVEHSIPGPWDIQYVMQAWGSPLPNNPSGLLTAGFTQSIRLVYCDPGSPTPTPTPSETPVFSPTETPTASETATETPVFSVTASPSASASSTATPSPPPTSTPTRTSTASATASATRTRTATPSPSFTVSSTATPTPTRTATASASPTRSATGTGTPTLTATPSASPTVEGTATPTATLSATPSITPLIPDDGVVLMRVVGGPNPNPKRLHFELSGNAADLKLKLYTPAYVLALSFSTGPLAGPWAWVAAPPELLALPNGLYYLQASAQGGDGTWTKPKTTRLYLAR